MSERDLEEMGNPHGKILNIDFEEDPRSGKSMGYDIACQWPVFEIPDAPRNLSGTV
jgi:hypothetical protein